MTSINKAVHGILNLNKPSGMTSNQALGRVKRFFLKLGIKTKFGYIGTLDPFAKGVLPVVIGKATKLADYLLMQQKEYAFVVSWGKSTDSWDKDGKVVDVCQEVPCVAKIKEFCNKNTGMINQIPPLYSAIKIDGKRACDIMRKDNSSRDDLKERLKKRAIEIFSFNILNHTNRKTKFVVNCSKGTYIRALVRDMSEYTGIPAHTSELVRIKTGGFYINEAITIEELENIEHQRAFLALPNFTLFDDGISIAKHCSLPQLVVDDITAKKLAQGLLVKSQVQSSENALCLVIGKTSERVIGIAKNSCGAVIPKRIFVDQNV